MGDRSDSSSAQQGGKGDIGGGARNDTDQVMSSAGPVRPVAVTDWSIENVQDWMSEEESRKAIFQRYFQVFKDNEVAGKNLLDLDDTKLTNMGIKVLSHRDEIMEQVKTLKDKTASNQSGALLEPANKRRKTECRLMGTEEFKKYCTDTRLNFKRIPIHSYSDYRLIRTEMCFYRDVTHTIKLLQQREGHAFSLLRPPRFGKSTLLSMFEYFYGVEYSAEFDFLFTGTDVHSLQLVANQNMIFRINLATVYTDYDVGTTHAFGSVWILAIQDFVARYEGMANFPEEVLDLSLNDLKDSEIPRVQQYFAAMLGAVKQTGYKVVILIDEYDAPVNSLMLSKEISRFIRADSFAAMKTFYAIIKENLGTVVSLCFLTGVFRMALAEISTGFNCCTDLSQDPEFVAVLGLLEEDVKLIIQRSQPSNQKLFEIVKRECNGYRFANKASQSVYCTNFVMEQLMAAKYENPSSSSVAEAVSTVLEYTAGTVGGTNLLHRLLDGSDVTYDVNFDTKFKFAQLNQPDNTAFATSILLHLGLATYHPTSEGRIQATNPGSKKHIAKYLARQEGSAATEAALDQFLGWGDIQPLLNNIQSCGVFVSEKAESYNHNEIVPHNMFAVAANLSQRNLVEYEFYTKRDNPVTGGGWIDCLGIVGNTAHIVEWKNISLEYLYIAGQDNAKGLLDKRKAAAVQKAKYLRKMDKSQVWNLQVVDYSFYNRNKTMKYIVDNTFEQTSKYISQLLQNPRPPSGVIQSLEQLPPLTTYFVHVCLAVGSSWLLHKTQRYDKV